MRLALVAARNKVVHSRMSIDQKNSEKKRICVKISPTRNLLLYKIILQLSRLFNNNVLDKYRRIIVRRNDHREMKILGEEGTVHERRRKKKGEKKRAIARRIAE